MELLLSITQNYDTTTFISKDCTQELSFFKHSNTSKKFTRYGRERALIPMD